MIKSGTQSADYAQLVNIPIVATPGRVRPLANKTLRNYVMQNAKSLVADAQSLISFPTIAIEVGKLLNSDKGSASEVARLIESDPALTTKLLRVANSAAFASVTEVDTVAKAITRIGSRAINQVLMGVEVARCFDGVSNTAFAIEEFWRHSIYTALIAQNIANVSRTSDPGLAFTAGLLHDIGDLILYNATAELGEQCFSQALLDNDGLETQVTEQSYFGFDHSDVGYELAHQWQLPTSIQDSILGHHAPSKIDNCPALVYIVHLANSLAVLFELDSENFSDAPRIAEETWQKLNIEKAWVGKIIGDVKSSADEILAAFSA